MPLTFERQARLLDAESFTACFAARRRITGSFYAINLLATGQPARLGLTVSRKADKRAVVRNRIKRVAREQFRQQRPQLAGYDLVVSARRQAAEATCAELADDFNALLQRLPALP